MDRRRRPSVGLLCRPLWRSTLGFHSKSFRFEGGGRRVIGLKRTGKSCRLRWVNYLHPGVKRGKMTPHEEKLVLELHSQFGNRWSKIARRLPGRTDNEIKNYWRTHTRKKAQEQKRAVSPSSSSSNCCSSSSRNLPCYSKAEQKNTERKFHETGGIERLVTEGKKIQPNEIVCSMDDIWRDITSSSDEPIKTAKKEETVYSMDEIWDGITSCADESIETVHDDIYCEAAPCSSHSLASPFWDLCPDNLWKVDEEAKILLSSDDEFLFPLDEFLFPLMNPKYRL